MQTQITRGAAFKPAVVAKTRSIRTQRTRVVSCQVDSRGLALIGWRSQRVHSSCQGSVFAAGITVSRSNVSFAGTEGWREPEGQRRVLQVCCCYGSCYSWWIGRCNPHVHSIASVGISAALE